MRRTRSESWSQESVALHAGAVDVMGGSCAVAGWDTVFGAVRQQRPLDLRKCTQRPLAQRRPFPFLRRVPLGLELLSCADFLVISGFLAAQSRNNVVVLSHTAQLAGFWLPLRWLLMSQRGLAADTLSVLLPTTWFLSCTLPRLARLELWLEDCDKQASLGQKESSLKRELAAHLCLAGMQAPIRPHELRVHLCHTSKTTDPKALFAEIWS